MYKQLSQKAIKLLNAHRFARYRKDNKIEEMLKKELDRAGIKYVLDTSARCVKDAPEYWDFREQFTLGESPDDQYLSVIKVYNRHRVYYLFFNTQTKRLSWSGFSTKEISNWAYIFNKVCDHANAWGI